MRNKILKIPGSTSANRLIILYEELEKTNSSIVDLELPSSQIKLDFSLMFSLVQFVATWLRRSNSGNLILPVSNIEDAIKYLNDKEFVYPSIVLCWDKEIQTVSGENIRLQLKQPSRKYFNKMEFFGLKGSSVPIYCFDYDKVSRGKSRHFYGNGLKLVSQDTLGFNLHSAYNKVSIQSLGIIRENLKGIIEDFNTIIHESFANTDEHAVTNEKGHYLYPNIRGVQLKFHKKTINGFQKVYSDFKGLVEYFSSTFKLNTQKELFLIEISIVDSGPGLYKRYSGQSTLPSSINDEVNIIKECLYRHNTSETGIHKSTKGIGLDRILSVINKKGFVRIRTGRCDVFRNMRKHQYKHHKAAQEIQLYDTQLNTNNEFKTNSFAEGTLISIFYPLESTHK